MGIIGAPSGVPTVAADGSAVATVAVLIPCFNEAKSIAQVVSDFRLAIPSSTIYVYDNNSTDDTVVQAQVAGAIVRKESQQGKGHVVRRMFADVEADVYVLVDGDDTYDASVASDMVKTLIDGGLDLVNGRRLSSTGGSYRVGHRFGNWALSKAVATIFGARIGDMLSGLKVMSRRFVKSFPCLTTGFEIETEITVHALELQMAIAEVPSEYRARSEGSISKLNTLRDGLRISMLILRLLRAERPMTFFGSFFVTLGAVATYIGLGIFQEYRRTRLVRRYPTAILCTGMMLLAFLSLACGMILETVTLGRREEKKMVYLSIPCRLGCERPAHQ